MRNIAYNYLIRQWLVRGQTVRDSEYAHIYSHFPLVLANQGAAMGFNNRLEGCVVEVAVCKPIGQLLVPDAVVAFI